MNGRLGFQDEGAAKGTGRSRHKLTHYMNCVSNIWTNKSQIYQTLITSVEVTFWGGSASIQGRRWRRLGRSY